MRLLIAFAALALAGAAAQAQTPAVDAARVAGSVGERYDGYLGFASSASVGVRSQVGAINLKRRALYSRLAGARGASPQDVGVTAGCSLLARVGVGQAYMWADGVWRRRAPGGAAPLPDYCR
jgi:uncharacterized protein YdbL (DUF1318 family)